MDLGKFLTELIGNGLAAPLASLVILPIIYRIVGVTKRERREREARDLRMDMDLARGLSELAQTAGDAAARAEYDSMRAHVLRDFQDKARAHFQDEMKLLQDPTRRYWLLPRPSGLFSTLWALLAIATAAVVLMTAAASAVMIVATIAAKPSADVGFYLGVVAAAVIFIASALAPMLLFRWLAYVSARLGRPGMSQSQSQSQSQMQGMGARSQSQSQSQSQGQGQG